MASYNELNALIDAYINRNGVQAITGQILNGVLKAMVEQLGRGYTIMGAAIPTTGPGTPDGPECYFASAPGTYTDFDGLQIVPGELALLCYTPSDGWTKATIYEGFQEVGATIDGNVGTPSVGVSYAGGVLSFDFHDMKGNPGQNGQDGAAAGFGTIGADITGGVGTPGVTVESSGPATAKNLQFHFTNLKGETGVTSVVATVDNTTGTPACTVSLVGQQLTLAFTGLKGAQGDTGSSVDYPFTIVNNLTTDDPTQALSAAQGVVLQGELSQLEAEVAPISGEFSKLPLIAEFNGSTSVATITGIVLENEGDSIELELWPGTNALQKQYGLAQKNYNIYLRLGASQTAVSVRADDDTWIATAVSFGGTKTHYIFKVAFEDGATNVYVDGTQVATYAGQKKITINRWGDYNSNFWEGKIGYVKANGTTYQSIVELPGWSATDISLSSLDGFLSLEQSEKLNNAESATNKTQTISKSPSTSKYPSEKAVVDYAGEIVETTPIVKAVIPDLNKLVPRAYFHNATAECSQIDFSQDGDSFEVELWPDAVTDGAMIYAMAHRSLNEVGIGASRSKIFIRANDDTWIANNVAISPAKEHFVLKVAYESGNINVYVDGSLVHTYTGQKNIRIKYWGLYSSGSDNYWKGTIGFVSINGVKYTNPTFLPGWTSSTVENKVDGVIISPAQEAKINSIQETGKDIHIVPASNKVGVYVRVNGDVYAYLEVTHFVNNNDSGGTNPYCDLWRIGNDAFLYKREGNAFTKINNTSILVGSENEFAIRFGPMVDYTGGYHGNEKIVAANGDYVLFFVNGMAYTITDLVTLGETDCDSFSYRQVSTLFADYAYNANHLKIASHFKDTEFKERGYITQNYMEMDLSELAAETLNIAWAFLGLVCVGKDCANIVTGDNGEEFTAVHPVSTTLLAEQIDKYSRMVMMRKDNISCIVDTELLGTNIASWEDAPTKVDIYDRQYDTKYYSYMPASVSNPVAVATGDFYANKCFVSWNYKKTD